jgi:2',3'-cyclic-nucleotide 2'-phosphodiesterase/3'-nucleotidase
VSQPHSRARLLTRIDLDLEREDGRWRVAGWQGDNIETKSVDVDASLMAAFDDTHRELVAALDAAIGSVTAPLSIRGCRLADCAAVDLIHAVQLEASGAQLSMASLLSDRTPDLPSGPVSWRWVHALYVYPNTLVSVALDGAQLRDIIEHAARYYDGLECPPSGGCTVVTDPSIPHYNVDSLAGLSYRIDPTRPEGDRVRDLRYRGSLVESEDSFSLVCNNYRAAGGGLFPHLADAEIVWTSSKEVTDLIGDYLTRNDPWRPTVDANWWIGPKIVAEEQASAAAHGR